MIQRIYQIDAFADGAFTGNPAAVCPLKEWLPDETMQKIALENNLSETAFYVKENDKVAIRWFTPKSEVDLCGHATLAASYVLYKHEGHSEDEILFYSEKSGHLPVRKSNGHIVLDFPADELTGDSLDLIQDGLGKSPIESWRGVSDLLLVFRNEEEIKSLTPDFNKLRKIDVRGIIVTAKGNETDFVSRFFGPQVGIDEDPVTGSAHTSLTPLWAKRLGKNQLTARQLSERGGYLECELKGSRVEIAGAARLYMIGEIFI